MSATTREAQAKRNQPVDAKQADVDYAMHVLRQLAERSTVDQVRLAAALELIRLAGKDR